MDYSCSLFENLYQQLQIQDMAKASTEQSKSQIRKEKKIGNRKKSKRWKEVERSKKNSFQFFEILKGLKELQEGSSQESLNRNAILLQVTKHIMHFFNKQRRYALEVLDRYIVCLANLMHILGNQAKNLNFGKEFKRKISVFCQKCLLQKQKFQQDKQMMHAILCILAYLIRQENISSDPNIYQLNQAVCSDKNVVKFILSMHLIKDKKISKFYGIILQRLINQHQGRKMKEVLIKTILLNFQKIDHQVTFFRFISFLRNERNRIKVYYQDFLNGKIIQNGISSYKRYINNDQSFEILDYLIYIIHLFPSLVQTVKDSRYVRELLCLPISVSFRQLHQSNIVSLIKNFIKYSSSKVKMQILEDVISYIKAQASSMMAIKMGSIFAEYDIKDEDLIQVCELGYFSDVLAWLDVDNEINFIQEIRFFKVIISKISKASSHIAQVLRYRLISKLKAISIGIPRGWIAFHNHIDQFMI